MEAASHDRARALYAALGSVNFRLYEATRRDILRGVGADRLLEWMPDWPDGNARAKLVNCGGYAYLDELISGVLQFEEPTAEPVQLESEIVETARREIRICTFGPCTPVVAEEQWLSVIGPLETDRIAIFRCRDYTPRSFFYRLIAMTIGGQTKTRERPLVRKSWSFITF